VVPNGDRAGAEVEGGHSESYPGLRFRPRASEPGQELRTLRLLGGHRRSSIEIESHDDAVLGCSGGSITEPLSLVVGPLHKAFSAAICQMYILASPFSIQKG
jgi:hypothetical protein